MIKNLRLIQPLLLFISPKKCQLLRRAIPNRVLKNYCTISNETINENCKSLSKSTGYYDECLQNKNIEFLQSTLKKTNTLPSDQIQDCLDDIFRVNVTSKGFFGRFFENNVSNNMDIELHGEKIDQVTDRLLDTISIKTIKRMFETIKYQNKHIFPWIFFEFRDFLNKVKNMENNENKNENENENEQKPNLNDKQDELELQTSSKLTELAVCFEFINVGTYLHKHLENPLEIKSSLSIPSFLVKDDYFTNKNLILGGDFCHTKAAKISSEIGYLEIPYYLAIIEEAMAKANLKMIKLNSNEYTEDTTKNDLAYIAYNELSIALTLGLKSVLLVLHKDDILANHAEQIDKIGISLGFIWHVLNLMKQRKTKIMNSKPINDIYLMYLAYQRSPNDDSDEIDQEIVLNELRNYVHTNIKYSKDALKKIFGNENLVQEFINSFIMRISME